MTVQLALRDVMAQFATGVSVVTTVDRDGTPRGTTASAVSSVSLEPPLILVCLGASSWTLAGLRESRVFAVNLLAADQGLLAHDFAKPGPKALWDDLERFEGVTGSPLLRGSLGYLDCVVDGLHPAGDHEIVVGHVLRAEADPGERDALLHFRRRLRSTA
jgi:flavin reductase (DIM6/NTAB) family NADH-FMN oxidoreductase RutF